jgi:hypothetical protein
VLKQRVRDYERELDRNYQDLERQQMDIFD